MVMEAEVGANILEDMMPISRTHTLFFLKKGDMLNIDFNNKGYVVIVAVNR
jgi:hypothetical protein